MDAGGAASSFKSWVTPLDASRRAAPWCAPLNRSWFRVNYESGGFDTYLWRHGRLKGRALGSGGPPRAPLVPTAVCTHGRTGDIDAYNEARHTIFDMALRFDLNPPRELAHIILTALARSAQCTEFYACILDALLCGRLAAS